MVITEKQNLQTSQADRRHRRMLERMNRILVPPRLVNRPRPEWNSQSQTLRSMDLSGLAPDNNSNGDMGGHSSIFRSLIQSVFDNLDPPRPDHLEDHDIPVVPLSCSEEERDDRPGHNVRIIPITFLDQSNNTVPTSPRNGKSISRGQESEDSSSKHILLTDSSELDKEFEIIDCTDFTDANTHSSKCIEKNSNSNRTLLDVIDCDAVVTAPSTNTNCDVEIIDCDSAPLSSGIKTKRDIICDDKNKADVIECSATVPLVRQSLPLLSAMQRSGRHNIRKNNTHISNEGLLGNTRVNLLEEDDRPAGQGVRMVRSNKDTLVGGANKVLGDVGPEGYYKGDNLDVPPGAAYLSGHVSSSQDGNSLSFSDDEKPVNEVPNYPIYLFLKKKLMKECRQIDHIKGDGNCFFRALSKQLYGSERYHIVLRNLIVDIVATNKSKFSQFVDDGDVQDHVERMSQEQSWATTCEIYAAATLLQRDVFMLTPDHLNQIYSWLLFKPVFKSDVQHSNIESHPCYITLCNTNGNHYDRIVGEHGGCNCFLPHPELDGVSYSVDLTC